jgi:CubicO group peptidase (beta-lactamase class C family)
MTMNRRDWLISSSALLAAACARQSESAISSKSAPAERVDIPAILQLASVPGMAIATVRGADVSVEGFGIRRVGTEERVTGDTVFEAASLSKPVFASIVMQLAAEAST